MLKYSLFFWQICKTIFRWFSKLFIQVKNQLHNLFEEIICHSQSWFIPLKKYICIHWMVRFQSWSFGECGLPSHCHYSQVHSDQDMSGHKSYIYIYINRILHWITYKGWYAIKHIQSILQSMLLNKKPFSSQRWIF